MKGLWFKLLLPFILLALLIPACRPAPPPTPVVAPVIEIPLGALQDCTGPTSDVGKDEFLAVREAVTWVNDTEYLGKGVRIKLYQYDYGYRVPEAITTYKRFRDYDKVVAVMGWGTGDTEALSPTVAKDKIAYLSSSFSGHLCDPKKTPYNFVYGTDYSTNARVAITAWYDEIWLKDPRFKAEREAGVKPRFVCFFSFPIPYCTAPIKALKEHAKMLGFEIGPDQDVSLTALDTKSQVLAAKEFKPHLVWHGNTTMSVATALKDAYALKLGADHIVNNWGYDENLIKLAGPAAEGVIGLAVSAFFMMPFTPGEPGVTQEIVHSYAKKVNPGIPFDMRLVRTTQGWVKVLITSEGLKRAKVADQIRQGVPLAQIRISVKEALETFRDWDPGLGAQPVTYTPTDHRPNSKAKAYIIKGGKFEILKEIDLKARWPDLWPKWLGW